MKTMLDVHAIVDALRQTTRKDDDFVALHEPVFGGREWDYVKECLDTGWVSSVGKFVDEFEQRLANYTGIRRAVAVVNGTAALHMCLELVGVTPGDEVLIPALTFVATANAVMYCDAIPHFVDCSTETLGLDPVRLRAYLFGIAAMENGQCVNKNTGRRIKAVVPMHTFGHPVDMDPLIELCNEFNLELVEDAAESLGSFYKKKHTGNFGRVAAMSFNGNKIVTTGGGGAILTNDEELANRAKHITKTAKVPHKWRFYHDEVGYNYRLPNLNAALGVAQMEQMDTFTFRKRNLAEQYQKAFSGIEGVTFFVEPKFARSNYWLNAILLDESLADERDNLLEYLNQQNLMVRPVWMLLNKLPMYEHCPSMELQVANSIEKRLINIPSSANLGE